MRSCVAGLEFIPSPYTLRECLRLVEIKAEQVDPDGKLRRQSRQNNQRVSLTDKAQSEAVLMGLRRKGAKVYSFPASCFQDN